MRKPKSPLPWRHENEMLVDASGEAIFIPCRESDYEIYLDYDNEDVDYIVKCVNLHEELVATLKSINNELNRRPDVAKMIQLVDSAVCDALKKVNVLLAKAKNEPKNT